jgi:hypothetical protein
VTTISIKKPNLFSNIIPLCFGPKVAIGNSAVPAAPVLISESSPVVDLKKVLAASAGSMGTDGDLNQPGSRRALAMRASVASTALRRASEALSMIQFEQQEQAEDVTYSQDGLEVDEQPITNPTA